MGSYITASSTDTLTNKTFDANGTGNSITNIENADISGSAAIATSKLADSSNFVLKNTAQTYDDGIKLTFNPDGTNAGINVGSHTAAPSSPVDGDLYLNSTDNKLYARINGAWVDLGQSGGGGATVNHAFSNTTTTSYQGDPSNVYTNVGQGNRDIYIKKFDANNEGVFTKIWKNGSAVEVQIA